MNRLKETGDISKEMLQEKAKSIWSRIQNKELTAGQAVVEIEELETEIKVLKTMEEPLTDEEKFSYAPVEIVIRELKKAYKQMK